MGLYFILPSISSNNMGINCKLIKNHSKTQALYCCQLLLLSSQSMLALHGYKGRHQTPSSFSSLPFLASLPRILHCHQASTPPSPFLSLLCPINYSVAQVEDNFVGWIIFLFFSHGTTILHVPISLHLSATKSQRQSEDFSMASLQRLEVGSADIAGRGSCPDWESAPAFSLLRPLLAAFLMVYSSPMALQFPNGLYISAHYSLMSLKSHLVLVLFIFTSLK